MKEKVDIVKSFGSITLEDITDFRLAKVKKKLGKKIWLCNTFTLVLLFVYFIFFCSLVCGLLFGKIDNQVLVHLYIDMMITLIFLLFCKITGTMLVLKLKLITLRSHYKEQTPSILMKFLKHEIISQASAFFVIISFIVSNVIFFGLLR